jgi:hypothetical protein
LDALTAGIRRKSKKKNYISLMLVTIYVYVIIARIAAANMRRNAYEFYEWIWTAANADAFSNANDLALELAAL